MGRKRYYKCERCEAICTGSVALAYHVNAHKRTDPVTHKERAPKRRSVYTGEIGHEPATLEGDT